MFQNWSFNFVKCSPYTLSLDPGIYVLEVWGASGGSYKANGGLGGYSKGTLILNETTEVFVHVGSLGSDTIIGIGGQGCNGGGYGYSSNGRSGGGATDIRLKYDDINARVIVAGGGGGSAEDATEPGGYGGGENGGNGADAASSAGKGAGQLSETKTCADGTSTSCPHGLFLYGGNATGSNGGGGGGGWFGGSSSPRTESGGGGSGYVLTNSSFKPDSYLLKEEKYFLLNVSLIAGNSNFPKPDKTGNETGHKGNGFASITLLREIKPLPTLPPIPSILSFSFTQIDETEIKDEYGKFFFSQRNNYTSRVRPGKYLFFANGTKCGQSIVAEIKVNKTQEMKVSITHDAKVLIDNELFIQAPGFSSGLPMFIHPSMKIVYNFTLSAYQCKGIEHSTVVIEYTPPSICRATFNRRITIQKDILLMFFVFNS